MKNLTSDQFEQISDEAYLTWKAVGGCASLRDVTLRAVIDADRALNGWLPIETAPRGSDNEFLGWDGQTMNKTFEGWEEESAPVYVHADYVSWNPTHWMPLPPPPKDEQ